MLSFLAGIWPASGQSIPRPTPAPGTRPSTHISEIAHNIPGGTIIQTEGTVIRVTMLGTPGRKARFAITALDDGNDDLCTSVRMLERRLPGYFDSLYRGSFAVPTGVSGAFTVKGKLDGIPIFGSHASNTASPPIQIDTVPPCVTLSTVPSPTSDTTPTLTGTAIPAMTVTINIDNEIAGTEIATEDGYFSFMCPVLEHGLHKAVAAGQDCQSDAVLFEIDTEPPAITSFMYTPPSPVYPGDLVTITLQGEAGGYATSVRSCSMLPWMPCKAQWGHTPARTV